MRPLRIQVELTDDEVLAISGAILIAKQSVFGHALDKTAMLIVNDNTEHLDTASIKFAKAIRVLKTGWCGV